MNYSKELEKLLQNESIKGNRLFLHSCCAPCSSSVLEYLAPFFRITVFYYNPNITAFEEYRHRVEEQKRLICAYNEALPNGTKGYPIEMIDGDYEPKTFLSKVKGLEDCPERGERCFICYELRMRKTASLAKELGMDYFATTLTLSPLKDAAALNEIGFMLEEELGIPYLGSDVKKKGGYQRSVELSKQYDLYRQDFCGCAFSKAQREKEKSIGNILPI